VGTAPARAAVWAAALAVAVAALLAYLGSLQGTFVWDDHDLIVENPWIKSWDRLGVLFTHDFFHRIGEDLAYGYYRPVVSLTYMADYALWGLRPLGFHLTNTLLHAACSALIVLVLLALNFDLAAAASAGLLFALHPIHTESVAWIAGRTDLVAFFFCALALLAELRARPRRWLGIACFALGLLAKEMSVVLVGWLLLIYRLSWGWSWPRTLRRLAPYLLVSLGYVLWRFWMVRIPLPGVPPEHNLASALLSVGPTLVRYLGWLAFPVNLNAYVLNPYVRSLADPRGAAGWLALGILSWLLLRTGRRDPKLGLLGAMLLVSFLPLLNLARVAAPADMGLVMAERFCYFPSFPFAAGVGYALAGAWLSTRSRRWPRLGRIGLVTLAGCGALVTIERNQDWRDERTFITKTLEQSPTSALLWTRLAASEQRRGDLGAAGRALSRASALQPASYSVLGALAGWFAAQRRFGEAVAVQETVARGATRGKIRALNNLALLYALTGRRQRAQRIWERLVEEGHGYAAVFYNLAEIYRARGQLNQARTLYSRALAERPEDRRVAVSLANLERAAGKPAAAERVYGNLLLHYPGDPRILNNLGSVLQEKGDLEAAMRLYRQAVAADPRYAMALFNYGNVLVELGRRSEARQKLKTVVHLDGTGRLGRLAAERLAELSRPERR
jgi:tetratricopeptide (TPR) repeat protein